MDDDKRMAGGYEIIRSFPIGDREVVIGENRLNVDGQKYMTALGERNNLFVRYDEVMVSDDYLEIVDLFALRVKEQAQKVRVELAESVPMGAGSVAITESECHVIDHDDDINGKIIVIRADVLRPEYGVATHQLKLCEGGFGAWPHSRGSAVYCKDLCSGKTSRFERRDVLGTMEPDELPKWARDGLAKIVEVDKQKRREEAR